MQERSKKYEVQVQPESCEWSTQTRLYKIVVKEVWNFVLCVNFCMLFNKESNKCIL